MIRKLGSITNLPYRFGSSGPRFSSILEYPVRAERSRSRSHHFGLGDGDDETTSGPPVVRLLLEYLVGVVPCEQHHVVRRALEHLLGRPYRDAHARHVVVLLVWAPVGHLVDDLPSHP